MPTIKVMFAGACLLAAALFSPAVRAEVLAVDVRCTSEDLGAVMASGGWERYADGRVVVTPQQPACWVRIDSPFDGRQQLVFAGNWVDVALYDAHGQPLAAFSRGGAAANSIGSSSHIVTPVAPGAEPRYARLSLVPGWGMAAESTVQTAALAQLVAAASKEDSINLATVAALVCSALFLGIFAVVLRFASYALLAGYLFLTACARLLDHGQIYLLADHGPWIWPLWAAIWPLVNCVLALTCASIGGFRKQSPRVHQATLAVAILFLPLCLVWPVYPALSDDLNAVLNVPLYALLLAGSWIGMRRGDAACAVLLAGNLLGAAVVLPAVAARWPGAYWLADPAMPPASWLAVAADLAIPLLLCIALARRQLELQRRAKALQLEALALASHDTLTGLLNRDSVERHGDALAAGGTQFCVVVLNVDRFKPINEALGGAMADQLLQAIAERLRAIDGAVAARLHADQFCLVWTDVVGLDALRVRVHADCARPVAVNGQMVDLPLSAGVAIGSVPPLTMAQLLRNAELALDTARARQLPWLAYSAALERGGHADLGLLSELDRAVREGELRMFLQPKIRMADGAVPSAEALVRWQHPVRGMLPPLQFVPFAVKTGRIAALTDWMLEQAMAMTRAQREAGTPLQISVNVSARDLARPGLAEQLAGMALRHGAVPDDIRLEVTESEAMEDPARALEAMRALCAAGFSLSIDDFGTGYSSLVYLQQMPVVELKIDRAFIAHVGSGADAAVLLRSTIELGHRLGLSVVAEGPETAQQWAMVKELGCDYAQGWHAAAAMDAASFLAWRAHHVPFLGLVAPTMQPTPMGD